MNIKTFKRDFEMRYGINPDTGDKSKTEAEIVKGFTADQKEAEVDFLAIGNKIHQELEDELRAEINHADHNNPEVD